jgi:hypothetical protein
MDRDCFSGMRLGFELGVEHSAPFEHGIPVGTRVFKTQSKPGEDTHGDGALGKVIAQFGTTKMPGYFVEWDDMPGISVFVAGHRLEPIPRS